MPRCAHLVQLFLDHAMDYVKMPAWLNLGTDSVVLPSILFHRSRQSWMTTVRAWLMCSEPVTCDGGDGMTSLAIGGELHSEELSLCIPPIVPGQPRWPWGCIRWPWAGEDFTVRDASHHHALRKSEHLAYPSA